MIKKTSTNITRVFFAIILTLVLLHPAAAEFKFVFERPEKLLTTNAEIEQARKDGYEIRTSKTNPNCSWAIKTAEINNENELLAQLGVENNDISVLSEGQLALLKTYQYSQSEYVNQLWTLADNSEAIQSSTPPGTLEVRLTDDTDFYGRDAEELHGIDVKEDFWPASSGGKIRISASFHSGVGMSNRAPATLLHEFAHSLDNRGTLPENPYGLDGTHRANEMTNNITAWREGWAIYNEMIEFEFRALQTEKAITEIRIESNDISGSYTYRTPQSLSAQELLKVEGLNSAILYDLATKLPDGRTKVNNVFKSSNEKGRDLSVFLSAFLEKYPEDSDGIDEILKSRINESISSSDFIPETPQNSDLESDDEVVVAPLQQGDSDNDSKSIWQSIVDFFKNLFGKKESQSGTTGDSDIPNDVPEAPASAEDCGDPVLIDTPGSNPFE